MCSHAGCKFRGINEGRRVERAQRATPVNEKKVKEKRKETTENDFNVVFWHFIYAAHWSIAKKNARKRRQSRFLSFSVIFCQFLKWRVGPFLHGTPHNLYSRLKIQGTVKPLR